jgi:Ca-activated chloride channel family protein
MAGGMGGMGAMGGMMGGHGPGQNAAGRAALARRAAPAGGIYGYNVQREGQLPALEAEQAGKDLKAKVRQIGAKTFYFKDNRWIDSTVKPEEDAKARVIRQFSDEFFHLARSQSAEWNQYLTFSEPVTLRLAEGVYRIDPADSKP